MKWFESCGAIIDTKTGEVDIQIRERVRYGEGQGGSLTSGSRPSVPNRASDLPFVSRNVVSTRAVPPTTPLIFSDKFQRIAGIAKSAQLIPQNIAGSYDFARFDF